MTRLVLIALAFAGLGACSPYVQNDPSAAAGASARPGSLLVRVNPDSGAPEQVLPTSYPDFHPGDRVRILADGTVVPL